jgi:NADH-quinone oxidoreductase subunit E
LEALKIVQKHQGWVSDESLLGIAKYLDIPAADLEGVATFLTWFIASKLARTLFYSAIALVVGSWAAKASRAI